MKKVVVLVSVSVFAALVVGGCKVTKVVDPAQVPGRESVSLVFDVFRDGAPLEGAKIEVTIDAFDQDGNHGSNLENNSLPYPWTDDRLVPYTHAFAYTPPQVLNISGTGRWLGKAGDEAMCYFYSPKLKSIVQGTQDRQPVHAGELGRGLAEVHCFYITG